MHGTYFDRNVPTASGDTQKTIDKQCMTLTLIEMSPLSVVIHRKQQTDRQCMTLTLIEMSPLSVVIHRKQQTMHDTYFDRNVPTVSGDTQKTTDNA